MKLERLFLLVIMSFVVNSAFAQKYLEKPFDKWSNDESMKVLSDSSWAKTYQSNVGAAAADADLAARSQADNRVGGSERGRSERSGGPPPVVIRLHSALPIRQALTRLNMIAAGYDKMPDKGKSEFVESAKKLLECAICQTHYVVTITRIPDSKGQFVEEPIFQGMTLEQMKGNMWLANEKGEKRDLVQFIAPIKRGDAAVFFFAREDDKGTVLLSPSNTDLNFVFNNNFFTSNNRFASLIPRKFEFKVSKMTVGENLMF